MTTTLSRRALLAGTTIFAAWTVTGRAVVAQQVQTDDFKDMKPGQYTWNPERSPEGPVAIIVSIPDQRVFVYRNGIRIAVSTCSTGKPGHATPTGVFSILQKDKDHHSDEYNDAPMPNMNRLTWSGVALHAGELPGYPDSHGCVRLPLAFSALLFTITQIGTVVIIANSASDPADVDHPGLVLSADADKDIAAQADKLKDQKQPSPDDPNAVTVSVLVSSPDKTIEVLKNGDTIAKGVATISNPDQPLGDHVFILEKMADGKMKWCAIAHGQTGQVDTTVIDRVRAEPDVINAIQSNFHVGLVFVTTDLPSTPDTRTAKNFVVMQQEPDPTQ
ncbi:L,D-transpeptidase [Aestuariivirga litoralis]|uniref:L,D-transpeptidase n=1 Tax=Aestuariivirga litoralis TaxID=2650924 RepID=A0A2W2AHU1_9HYPH|nr:L,D-transpeptidase [Aestuariivirga litoralis]PZF75065.1 L,D-transpeptidase [Aestuariivirga litoralis]